MLMACWLMFVLQSISVSQLCIYSIYQLSIIYLSIYHLSIYIYLLALFCDSWGPLQGIQFSGCGRKRNSLF